MLVILVFHLLFILQIVISHFGPHDLTSQKRVQIGQVAKIPIVVRDEWSIWSATEGYEEGNLYRIIMEKRRRKRKTAMITNNSLLDPRLYRKPKHSQYFYARSSRVYSLKTQVMARGRSLMTNRRTTKSTPSEKKLSDPCCPHCRNEIEDEHHIFVSCEAYAQAKREAIRKLTNKLGKEAEEYITKTFNDGEWWCGERGRYYLGWVPKIVPTEASTDIHSEVLRVAGRIREMRMKSKYEIEKKEREEKRSSREERNLTRS